MEEGGGNKALKTNEASINSVEPNRSESSMEKTLTHFQVPKCNPKNVGFFLNCFIWKKAHIVGCELSYNNNIKHTYIFFLKWGLPVFSVFFLANCRSFLYFQVASLFATGLTIKAAT